MDPRELIGKYLAFDEENGMIWAYICDVRQLQAKNVKYKLITNNMRIKSGELKTQDISGCERALDWDYIKDREKLIFDPITQKITFPDNIKDTMMLTMLDAKPLNPFGTKAMALGVKDWLHLVQDDELKELLSNGFIQRSLSGDEQKHLHGVPTI